jgi:hypothetical protein
MPAQLEHTICCADFEATFQIESDSTDKMYTIDSGPDGLTCDCMAWRFKKGDKECKHTREVLQKGCFWHPQSESGTGELRPVSRDETVHVPGQTCPGCGGPVISITIAV